MLQNWTIFHVFPEFIWIPLVRESFNKEIFMGMILGYDRMGSLASNRISFCRGTDDILKSLKSDMVQIIHVLLWVTKWDETPPSFYSGVTFCSWHANQLACPFARFLASLSPIQSIVFVSLLHIEGLPLSRIEFPEKERSLLSPLNSNDQNIDRSISSNSVGGPTHV